MKGKQMAKATAAFKLPASIKRVLAIMPNKTQRAEVRKLFIDAELTAKFAPKSNRNKDKAE